jgi:hypothetical protein
MSNPHQEISSTSMTVAQGFQLPDIIQFQRVQLVIAKWKAERDAKCHHCKQGLDLGAHGCHFEDDGDESITVGNCKAWPLSRRIQQLEEAMRP